MRDQIAKRDSDNNLVESLSVGRQINRLVFFIIIHLSCMNDRKLLEIAISKPETGTRSGKPVSCQLFFWPVPMFSDR